MHGNGPIREKNGVRKEQGVGRKEKKVKKRNGKERGVYSEAPEIPR